MTVHGLHLPDSPPHEGLVEIDGSGYYAVHGIDRMAPFLMSVVSDGDRWMFLSSSGGLTAGRVDAARALFPYETDDRLHRAGGVVGAVSAVRVPGRDVWTPFRGRPDPRIRRSLYKSVVGDSVIFEEEHADLRLTARYRWASCDEFGFVRTASLINGADTTAAITLVDGLLGLLPYGLQPLVYQRMSNLAEAYMRSEIVDPATRLAAYTLESQVVDRPDPAEVLRASVAWSIGFEGASLTLAPTALRRFEEGHETAPANLVTATSGAYLLEGPLELGPGEQHVWHIGADVARDQRDVIELRDALGTTEDLAGDIDQSLENATASLVKMMAPADALQRTGDRVATAHHFSNVLYNAMRGGVPLAGYRLDLGDLVEFLSRRNRGVVERNREWLANLPPEIERRDLVDQASRVGDPHLTRLVSEYLPFSFSRRHGDPSRPWNQFSIRVRDDKGHPIIYYEGNWRDIFQNWEALALSFPEYLPGMISVFVNASTFDGFNPYRISRDGLDWEVPDPDDPWSNIGYWGDHQIVYLLRLLQAAGRYLPGRVERMLGDRQFAYAAVPYTLAPYDELVADPKHTISYDDLAASRSEQRVAQMGADGKLLCDGAGDIYLVTLTEKLLVPALSKLSNFVPGAGIWMNTQRPEWNDANNALVGHGASMVTLCYLRRYLDHLRDLLRGSGLDNLEVSAEVAGWLDEVAAILTSFRGRHVASDPSTRRLLLDDLGSAFTRYRSRVRRTGFSGSEKRAVARIDALCVVALEFIDDTIRRARRDDGLFNAYNLIRFEQSPPAVQIEPLQEMLEGQVAALASGVLSPTERADLVDALFDSALYRPDQHSFMLYPAHRPEPFLAKNVIPADVVGSNPLLKALIAAGDESMVFVDPEGQVRFHPDFSNVEDLEAALDRLATRPGWSERVAEHRAGTTEAYDRVFRHRAYTGRSGSMYGYEGIGSVYWHMVAKLLVEAQESVLEAHDACAPPSVLDRLIANYWKIRAGLGFNKTAHDFGAIPIDPYSHTPTHSGARQPGMTGLVKEELLNRPLEMGVRIDAGEIVIDPILMRPQELLPQAETWTVYGIDGHPVSLEVPAQSLGATLCQVPVIVSEHDSEPVVEVHRRDGSSTEHAGTRLAADVSAAVFERTGEIVTIRATVPAGRPGGHRR